MDGLSNLNVDNKDQKEYKEKEYKSFKVEKTEKNLKEKEIKDNLNNISLLNSTGINDNDDNVDVMMAEGVHNNNNDDVMSSGIMSNNGLKDVKLQKDKKKDKSYKKEKELKQKEKGEKVIKDSMNKTHSSSGLLKGSSTNSNIGLSSNFGNSNIKKAKKPKKKTKRELKFDSFIHKVLKQVHPSIGITKQAMAVMNDLVSNAFYQISEEAGRLVKGDRRDTLSERDISSAVKLVFPGELHRVSIEEGSSALKHYEENCKKGRDREEGKIKY